MSERAAKLGIANMTKKRPWQVDPIFLARGSGVPKLNLGSLLEALALAAGIPTFIWQTVPSSQSCDGPALEPGIHDMMLKFNIEYLDQPFLGHLEAGNRDE